MLETAGLRGSAETVRHLKHSNIRWILGTKLFNPSDALVWNGMPRFDSFCPWNESENTISPVTLKGLEPNLQMETFWNPQRHQRGTNTASKGFEHV